MASPENESSFYEGMARPGIPIRKPDEREVPDLPSRVPEPVFVPQPVRAPTPVPVKP